MTIAVPEIEPTEAELAAAAATATGDAAEGATDASAAGAAADAATDKPADADKPLGAAGQQAIDRMKAERKAANDRARVAEAALAEERAKAAGKETEYKAEQEAQKVRDDALAVANTRILKAEVRAAAAGKLSDPKDALQFIDLSEFEVDSDGNVDAAAIADAVTDLLEKKPYLAAQGGKRFEGSADGGARNDAIKTPQLTKADVEKLSAEGKHEEIEAARVAGRLNTVLGIKT